MKSIAVGIDIGGTNTKYGLVDRNGNVLAKHSLSTPQFPKVEDFVAAVSLAVRGLIEELDMACEIIGIGIGAPNANYYTGTIENAPNLRWKGVIYLSELFKAQFEAPVVITNDANAAAIGEMVYGAAKGCKDFIMITLGTGVGSGFMVNGQLIYGHDGFAGEFGHVIAVPGGRLCTCGRRGCVETYAAARGVVLTVQEELAASTDESSLRNVLPGNLTPKAIFEAAEEGDHIAQRAFDYTGRVLGEALSNAVAITSPKSIFLFGGVARAGKWILEPTKKYMEASLLPIYQNKVDLIPSKLPGSEAAILGASALAWQELESFIH
jgi:glucokinase